MVNVLMESYPPFSFLNDHNQLDGYDVDVAKAVADKLGVKLRYRHHWDITLRTAAGAALTTSAFAR